MIGRGGGRLIGGLVGCAAVVAAVLGLSVIDTPETMRMQRLDDQRVKDIGAIILELDRYWSAHQGELPTTLAEIEGNLGEGYSIFDRVAGVPYEYRIETPRSYELCARFDSDGAHALPPYVQLNMEFGIEHRTIFGSGLQCFAIRKPLS